MKNEFKCSDISFMHDYTLHGTLHRAYVFLSETGIQSEKRSWTRQKLQKDFREERRQIQTDQNFQRISNPNQTCDQW